MKYFIIVITITILSSASYGASFDCRKASTLIENAICSDNELSELDDSLGKTYIEALSKATDKKALKSEQRAWLSKVRNKCQTSVCLKDVYRKRIAAIGKIDYSGEYSSRDDYSFAGVEIKHQDDTIMFSVNSVVESNSNMPMCDIEGTATLIDNNVAVYTDGDDSNKCVVVFKFTDTSVDITTIDCSGECGLNAAGSMDRVYKK